MLNSILLEVEGEWTCPDEPPKGPGTPVPPKKANPIEIKRVIVSIGTRRKNLVAARAKLQSAQHSGEPVAIACEKMRVKAAEGWLAFTNKRYELLRDLQKAKGSKTAEVASLLAWGDQQLARSQKHQAAGLDEPVPPIPDVTFDYKSNKMLGSDGKEFSVPEIDAVDAEIAMLPSYAPALEPFTLTPEPPAPAPSPTPEPPPPEPEPPKELTTLSPEHEEEIVAGLKKRLIAHAVTGYPVLEGSDVKEIAATVLGSDIPPPSDALQGSLAQQAYAAIVPMQTDPTPDELASIGMFADALVDTVPIVDGVPQFDKFKLGYQLRDNTAHTIGKILKVGSSQDIIEAAIEKLKKKPKPWHMFSMADQENIKAIVKKTAIWAASEHMDLMEAVPVIGGKLVSQGYYMAAAPLGSIVASYWGEYTHKNWEELSPEKQDALKGVAKSAQAIGANIFDAVKNAGIVHLSANGLGKLAAAIEPEKQPDEAGFLAAVDAALGANAHHPVDLLTFGDVVDTLQTSGKPLDDLMAEFHIKDAGGLQADMMKLAHAHLKGLVGSLAGLQNTVVTRWDVTAASGMAPDKTSFVDYAASALSTDGVSSAAFDTAFSQSRYAWLEGVYDEWHKKWAEETTPAPNAPVAGAMPSPAPVAPSLPASKPYLGYTNYKKISGSNQLTDTQKQYLQDKVVAAVVSGAHLTSQGVVGPKKLSAAVNKIHAEFKADWAPSGVTQIAASIIKAAFDKALTLTPEQFASLSTSPTPTEAANSAAAAAPSPAANAPEDHMALFEAGKHVLNNWETDFFPDVWKKTIAKGIAQTSKQKHYYDKVLAKLKKAIPIVPGVPAQAATPAQAVQVQPKAPTAQSPIGMSYEEIKNYAQLGKPALAPDKPGSNMPWAEGGAFGVGGSHSKKLLGTNAEFAPVVHTFKTATKATHAWMVKTPSRAGVASIEVAANRLQGLLGLPTTEVAWAEGNNIVQHFAVKPTLKHMPSPWENHPHADKIARQLQKAAVFGYLIAELDDHAGNFTLDPDGTITGIDKGQAFRFFDSSQSMMSHFKSTAHIADGGRVPKKMLEEWASGSAVPLMSLTDPEFEDFVSRAEAIPSDIYKNMLKPYAISAAGAGELSSDSSIAADKQPDSFIAAADARRTGIRASIGEFYAGLAKTRAKSLKTALGDTRPLSEIEAEVRDQLGLDDFLQGKKPLANAIPEIPSLAAAMAKDEEAGWDEAKLPKTSHIPDDAARKKSGLNGIDMMVGGVDVKDGRVQFFQLGDNDFQTFMLDTKARAKLQGRLPGAGGPSGPVMPTPVSIPAFEPPPKPKFEAKDAHALWRDVLGAAGFSTTQKHEADTTTTKTGEFVAKIEKHFKKWRDGEAANTQYLAKGYDRVKQLAASADPLEKAAGEHYKAEFLRIGYIDNYSSYALKEVSDVPEADREIKPFVPDAAILKAQAAAKAAGEAAYEQAVADGKAVWEADKAAADAAYQEKLADYQKEKQKFDAEMKAAGSLAAVKLDHYPVPAGVKHKGVQGGENLISSASDWGGAYDRERKHHENPMSAYEIDLTDAVTGTIGGAASPKKRLLVHYVPGKISGTREHPGRDGTVRIQFPEGATKEQIRDYSKAVYATLGMDARPASAADQELAYLRRMAWLRRLEGAETDLKVDRDEPAGSVSAKIEWWIDKFKKAPGSNPRGKPEKGVGFDPRYEVERLSTGAPKLSAGQPVYAKNPDGSKKRSSDYQPEAVDMGGGRFAFRRFDVSATEMAQWKASGLTLYKTSMSNLKEQVVNVDALFASEKRAQVGFFGVEASGEPEGQYWGSTSPSSDVKSGGANEVYFYMRRKQPSDVHENNWVHIDPEVMLYTSTWGHPEDSYGKKTDTHGFPGSVSKRGTTVQESRRPFTEMVHYTGSSAEILVGDKVSITRWVTRLKAGSVELRDKLIAKLKAAGTTTLGPENKPLEDVIVV